MNTILILSVMAILCTLIATMYDLRYKKIPHMVHVVTASVGITASFINNEVWASLIFGGFFLLVGFLVTISGGWGGGDGKFLGALGTFFYFNPVGFLLSLMASTMLFKAYIVSTDKDPGKIPRSEWLEKGVPFLPAFLMAEIIFLILSIL